MKTDEALQKDVQDAIKWEPMLHAAEVGVIVHNGIVTLTGTLDNFGKKSEAEQAAKKISGVKAVVDDIEVVIGKASFVSDMEIAANALRMLNESLIMPKDSVKVIVEDGWVTLEGTLVWNFQKDTARHLVKDLAGVKGVINKIKLKKDLHNEIEKQHIEDALRRHWAIDAGEIDVEVSGTTITLKGFVNSLYQKEEAEKIVYKTPGVLKVINDLVIDLEQPYLN